ncbi:MAG: glycosyltransferase family 39 protein [Magnetococcus sp. YQC-9]
MTLFPLLFSKGLSGNPDDYLTLQAASGWLNHFPFVGLEHRHLRYPHNLTVAGALSLLGENNLSLIASAYLYHLLLLGVTLYVVRRLRDIHTALWVLFVLSATPIFAAFATSIVPFTIEVFFMIASLLLFYWGRESQSARSLWLISAGIFAGLAWETRETSGALILMYGLLFLFAPGMERRHYFWMGGGFLTVWGGEMCYHAFFVGDPLYRFHVTSATFDQAKGLTVHLRHHDFNSDSHIFNFAMAASWMPSGLFDLHWSINAWINLFFEDDYGLLFWLALPAGWSIWHDHDHPQLRRLIGLSWLLGLCTIFWCFYLFTLMQQPRYVGTLPYAAALLVGYWLANLYRHSRASSLLLAALLLISGTIAISSKPDELFRERQLATFVQDLPEAVHILPALAEHGGPVLKPLLDAGRLRTTHPDANALVAGDPKHWKNHYSDLKALQWELVARIERPLPLVTRILQTIQLLPILPESIRKQLIPPSTSLPIHRVS